MNRNRFPVHGVAGVLLVLFAELSVVMGARGLAVWTTPVCWWGYILFLDALLYRLRGRSLLVNRRGLFTLQLVLSVLFWLFFEAYNLHLQNWRYVGLPESRPVTWVGYTLSFATILPALLYTAELLSFWGVFRRFAITPLRVTSRLSYTLFLLGFGMMIVPLLLPASVARYTFASVWIGVVFLLEPVLYASGAESLLRDLEKGRLERAFCLFASGYLCGILWEFWNYWATAKWVYTAPFTPTAKIFEMPLAGFLGFGPFAVEFFCMYHFFLLFGRKKEEKPDPEV